MNYFYTTNIKGNYAYLDETDSKHSIQVLRKRVGDVVQFVDGLGFRYMGHILEANKRSCKIEIQERYQVDKGRDYNLQIAIAPTKNNSRFEWFLEKSSEIGIDVIFPIICDYSERREIKSPRLNKILISGMKQSGQAQLPMLKSLCTFEEFLESFDQNIPFKYIATLSEAEIMMSDNYKRGNDVLIIIGPEGGFSPKEVEMARNSGFQAVSLGKSRLRTETAGIFVCSSIKVLNDL